MNANFKAAASLAALAAAATAAASARAQDPGHDRGDTVSETFDLKDFDSVDVSGVYELKVAVGEPFSIELKGDERDMDRIRVKVDGGVLRLDHEGRRGWRGHGDQDSVEARIGLPSLKAVEISGVVDGRVNGIDADDFEINVSGVGDMDFSGSCNRLKARISGVGDVEAEDLLCQDVDVKVSGVGDASVHAEQSVDATVSGMGDIEVYGSPEDVRETSGMFSDVKIHR